MPASLKRAVEGDEQLGGQRVGQAVHAVVVDRRPRCSAGRDMVVAGDQDDLEADRDGRAVLAAGEGVGLVGVEGRRVVVDPDQRERDVVDHGVVGGVDRERLVVALARARSGWLNGKTQVLGVPGRAARRAAAGAAGRVSRSRPVAGAAVARHHHHRELGSAWVGRSPFAEQRPGLAALALGQRSVADAGRGPPGDRLGEGAALVGLDRAVRGLARPPGPGQPGDQGQR